MQHLQPYGIQHITALYMPLDAMQMYRYRRFMCIMIMRLYILDMYISTYIRIYIYTYEHVYIVCVIMYIIYTHVDIYYRS